MMKRILQITLALWGAAVPAAARAVTVPQQSAADYIFTRPVLTNHIRGVVTDVTNAYGVIRSEDVDWYREAKAERDALVAGSLLAQESGVGAQVTRGNLHVVSLWNGYPRGSDHGWLDPGAPLLDSARLYDSSARESTNIYMSTAWRGGDLVRSNSITTITMQMKDGTTSVYTNEWSANLVRPVPYCYTNVHVWTLLDYCQPEGSGVFGGYTNTPDTVYHGGSYISGAPTVAELAYAGEVLQGTKRLADVGPWPTNRLVIVGRSRNDDYVSPPSTGTVGGISYSLHAHTQTNGYGWSTESLSVPGLLYVPTRFDSELCTAGGAHRVAVEALYADVLFSYSFADEWDHANDYSVMSRAVVRIADPALDLSGPVAVVSCPYDAMAVCSAAASAAGVPSVPSAGVGYVPSRGITCNWSVDEPKFCIVYRITPSVKLPDW